MDKVVVYLDQFVLIGMQKGEEPWGSLKKLLLRSKRTVVCPTSQFHASEAGLTTLGGPVLATAMELACDSSGLAYARFRDKWELRTELAIPALRRYLRLPEPAPKVADARIALESRVYDPACDIPETTDAVAKHSTLQRDRLSELFESARESTWITERAFSVAEADEAPVEVDDWLPAWEAYAEKSPGYTLYSAIRATFERSGHPATHDEIARFFESAEYQDVAYTRLERGLWARLRESAAHRPGGIKANHRIDIEAVSVLAPWCDFMFVDREIAGLLDDRRVGAREIVPRLTVLKGEAGARDLCDLLE